MKILFRIIIVLILIAILAAVLFRKKQQIAFDSAGAKYSDYEVPVQTAPITKQTPLNIIQSGGLVESSEEVIVVSTVQGKVKVLNATVGKSVKENEILAICDEFAASQEYNIAHDAYLQLDKDYKRYEKLAEEDAIAKQQLEQLKLQLDAADVKQQLLSKRLEDTKIKAPVNGIVNQVFIKQGATVGQGTPVCEIVNPEGLKITGHVGKNDIGLLKTGSKVNLSENFGNGKKYNGVVTGIGVKPDRSGRYPFNITINSDSKELKPGIILNAEVESIDEPVILVPRKVVKYLNGGYGVFIVENGTSVFKTVETGKSHGDNIEITSGLTEGMILIVDGYQFLEAGSKLKIEKK